MKYNIADLQELKASVTRSNIIDINRAIIARELRSLRKIDTAKARVFWQKCVERTA